MLNEIVNRLFGFRRPNLPLVVTPLPLTVLSCPSLLAFSLIGGDGFPLKPTVKEGDEVKAGQFLAHDGGRPALVSPVSGKVKMLTPSPDLRGARSGVAVIIEPAADSSPVVFAPLDAEKATAEALRERIEKAGIITDSLRPRPLIDLLAANAPTPAVVCVLALDREPEVSSALQSFLERPDDAAAAAKMMARAAGAGRAALAVPESMSGEVSGAVVRRGVEVLPVPAVYPQSLEPMVALRLGKGPVRIVAVETALAAYDAVTRGKVQDRKTLTVIGPDGHPAGNFSVAVGAPIGTALAAAGVGAESGDKVVAGGVMRGYAQYSLESAVDPGLDALVVIAEEDVVHWTDDPCVNCGACAAVCPVNLQVQLIGRYSEFGIFDRAEEFKAQYCIECGLCGSVCTARRPLLQLMRLAKQEIALRAAERRARERSEAERRENGEAA